MNMDNESLLRLCLEELGQNNGIAGLTLEPNDSAGLEVKDGRQIYVKLNKDQNKVYVYRVLFSIPELKKPAILDFAMKLNILGSGTHGGVLSWSNSMSACVYHEFIDGECLTSARLQETMERLLTHGDDLKDRFQLLL